MPRLPCHRAVQAAVTALTCLFASSCGVPFPRTQALVDDAARQNLTARFRSPPEGVRATLRVVLSFQEMELPITIRVMCMQPDRLRILAMDDLGGTLFHFLRVGDTTEIVSCAPQIPEPFLRLGLGRDLAAWLTLAPREGDGLVRRGDDHLGLLRERGEDLLLMSSEHAAGPIDRVEHGATGRLWATIQCMFDAEAPTSARIQNYHVGYTMDISVREWRAAHLSEANFKNGP